jgi:signal transduction histidine kinase
MQGGLDTNGRAWFLERGGDRDCDRPNGVRTWEWRLARLVARASEPELSAQDTEAESVLTAMDEFTDGLPPAVRAGYASALPTTTLLAAIRADERLDHAKGRVGGASAAMTDAARANLFRSGRGKSFYRGRAAGLERVLASALRLGTATSLDHLVGEIAAGLREICRAERAVVIHETAAGGIRAKLATTGKVEDVDAEAAELSRTALARVRATGRSELYDDAVGDVALLDRPSVIQFRPRSLLIAPLMTHGQCAGLVYVENRSVAKLFSKSDVELVEGFAAQAALALENGRLVHELRQAFQDLDAARARAIRAASLRMIGQMASEVAHDFNNLLTTILGETQLLLADDLAKPVKSALATVERAAMDSAEVVKRIQDMARGTPSDDLVAIKVAAIIDGVLELTSRRVERMRIVVSRHVPPDVSVQGIESELREVFTNILVNALDAMGEGGIIRIGVEPDASRLAIVIEDNGLGMDESTAGRIFEPFYTTKGSRGNGLGLSVAADIVRRHGGEITVSSRSGCGTRMVVSLPQAQGMLAVNAASLNRSHSVASIRDAAKPVVLIAESDATVGGVIARMVERIGGAATVAATGRRAVDLIDSVPTPYDLVIADVLAPIVDGYGVLRAAQGRSPATVIALAGVTWDSADDLTGHGLGGLRRLAKPVTLASIVELLAVAEPAVVSRRASRPCTS